MLIKGINDKEEDFPKHLHTSRDMAIEVDRYIFLESKKNKIEIYEKYIHVFNL